jgi:hypothetical protein
MSSGLYPKGKQASKPEYIRAWGQQTALDFAVAERELRDLVTLLAVVNVNRPCLAILFPVQRSRLWKFHDSEDRDSGLSVQTVNKCMLGCSAQGEISVLSDTAQHFTSLWMGSSCGYHVIQSVWLVGSYLPNCQHMK